MRIHANTLTTSEIYKAARIARVEIEHLTEHGSRKRAHAFEVKLSGESRRRPNNNGAHGDVFAATWDQWGVFLACLFDADNEITIPTAYVDVDTFHARTSNRFNPDGNDRADGSDYWPADAHGDHTFRYAGIPYTQACTKCSAVQRWM